MTLKKRLELSVICGLVFSILLSFSSFEASCNNVRRNVLRLHILANSDDTADQKLKLTVRDAVLECSEELFSNATSLEKAKEVASESLDDIERLANKIIKENGYNYTAKAELTNCYFNTRVYDNFTLPAGYYDAVRIKIGKAAGKNWWCVMFPKVCLSAAGDIGDNLNSGGEEIVKNPQKYEVKFKTVEIYYSIREKISSWF